MSRSRADADLFYGQDRYAVFALGTHHRVGSSFADSDIVVAARGLSESVVPDIDQEVLAAVMPKPIPPTPIPPTPILDERAREGRRG
jgi:hypothetical protein